MKTINHKVFYIKNPETGEFESMSALRGESAYQAAVRLGLTTLTEEQWLREYIVKRDDAMEAIEDKGQEVLDSIPDDYHEINERVQQTIDKTPIVTHDNGSYYVLDSTDVDNTLSVSGKVADAKVTGDKISQLTEDIGDLKSALTANLDLTLAYTIVENQYVQDNGTIKNYNGWNRTSRIQLYKKYAGLTAKSTIQSVYNAFYDANDNFISRFTVYEDKRYIDIPENARSVIFSNTAAGMENFELAYVDNTDYSINELSQNIAETKQLVDQIVYYETDIEPFVLFSNKYIDISSGRIDTFPYWSISKIDLKSGDHLTMTIGGRGACLAYCSDSEPTEESSFVIITSTNSNNYSVDYTASNDITLYVSSRNESLSSCNIIGKRTYSVSELASEIQNANNKIDAIGRNITNSKNGNGFSLSYNDAYAKITDFVYSTGLSNPWTAIVNQDDFENYGTYIDEKIASIPAGQSFIWITDVHYVGNRKHSGALVDYVRRKAGIKTVLHGGDVQNERPYAKDAAIDWFNFNNDYVGRIGSDFKQVCGDHDHNGRFWGNEDLRTQYNLTDPSDTFFTCKFVQKVLTGYCENEIVPDTTYDNDIIDYGWSEEDVSEYNAFKKMHYYFDDNKIKTRFIVLFTDWSWKNYGFPYNKIGQVSAMIVQMDFLYDALRTTPDGYNIVVCGHNTVISYNKGVIDGVQYWDTNSTTYSDGYWESVSKMLAGLRSKTSVNVRCGDWSTVYSSMSDVPYKSYDFSGAPTLGVMFTMGGDVHWDILSKTTVNTTSTISTLASGDTINLQTDIPHIVTMTDGVDRDYRDFTTRELICNPATVGTIDEQAFDVVTIAKDGLYLTRIGSGANRTLKF